jgi:hypothetical protein
LLGVGGQILPSAAVIQALTNSTTQAPAHLSALVIAAAGNITTTSAAAMLAAKTLHVMNWIKIKVAATIILAATVAGAGSVAVVKAIGPQSAPVVTAAPNVSAAEPAITDTPAAGAVATFPDGMRIEVIGIAPSPIRGQQWWRPDGSPLPQPPIRREYGQVTAPLSKVYTFVVKLTGADPTWDTGINVESSHGTASTDQDNLLCATAALTESPTATIDFVCANGPWQTRASVSADALYKTGVNLNGIVFTPGDDQKNNTVKLTADHASMNALFSGAATFIAIDLNGKIVPSSGMNGQGSLLTETKTYSFKNLRPDQIREFQIRSRPYNRSVKFQNISLVPGQLTAPTVEQHETGKFIATFAAGGSVEVVGISNWPSTNKWWQPDGTPLDPLPPDPGPYLGRDAMNGQQAYAIAVKWTNPQSPSWSSSFSGARDIGVSNAPHHTPGAPDIYRVIFPTADPTTTFRAGLAAGPWHQWPTVRTTVQATVSIDNTKITFSAPVEKAGDVIVTTTDPLNDVERQLVAIDISGVTHIADLIHSRAGNYNFRFPNITTAQIKSYQLQTRQYEYVNFKGLSLKPEQHSEITIEPDAPASPPTPPKPPGEEGL